jgi:two-component system nitrate/nitrite response regulator NarL
LRLDDGVPVMVEKLIPFGPASSDVFVNQDKKSLFIISKVRFLREGIAGVIGQNSAHFLAGSFENIGETLIAMRGCAEVTVLLDAAFPNGVDAIRELRAVNAETRLVVFAISETEDNIVAWAQAGADGYIPRTASLNELVRFVESTINGEQICSAAITSKLIRRLGSYSSANLERPSHAKLLTGREREIMRMVAKGWSNKEIARELRIELSTTKSHVHNLLGKLNFQRRGQVSEWAYKEQV